MGNENNNSGRVMLLVMTHGFVYIGRLVDVNVETKEILLDRCVNLRRADTTQGFGELVESVPKGNFDPMPRAEGAEGIYFSMDQLILRFELNPEVWLKALPPR